MPSSPRRLAGDVGIAGVEATTVVVDDHRDELVVGTLEPRRRASLRHGARHWSAPPAEPGTRSSRYRGTGVCSQRKMQVELNGGAFAPGLQKIPDRGLNGKIVQGSGPDLPGHPVDIAPTLGGDIFQCGQAFLKVRSGVGAADAFKTKLQERQRLTQGIVQLPRDPQTLRLLIRNGSAQDLRQFRSPPTRAPLGFLLQRLGRAPATPPGAHPVRSSFSLAAAVPPRVRGRSGRSAEAPPPTATSVNGALPPTRRKAMATNVAAPSLATPRSCYEASGLRDRRRHRPVLPGFPAQDTVRLSLRAKPQDIVARHP